MAGANRRWHHGDTRHHQCRGELGVGRRRPLRERRRWRSGVGRRGLLRSRRLQGRRPGGGGAVWRRPCAVRGPGGLDRTQPRPGSNLRPDPRPGDGTIRRRARRRGERRQSRCGRRARARVALNPRHRCSGSGGLRRVAIADHGSVREGSKTIRSPDRLLPGGQAPTGERHARHRSSPLAGLQRSLRDRL